MDSVTHSVNERFRGGAEHARHDRLLVSRFGAGDAYASEEEEARQLVQRCADCARLAADMGVLRTQLTMLPAPRRERDFRLTPQQADSLRGSSFQRWLRKLAAPGLAPIRPLAGVALSVGLVLVMAGVAMPTPAGELMALDKARQEQLGGDGPRAPAAGAEETPVPGAAAEAPRDRAYEGEPMTTADELGVGGELEQAEGTRQLLITAGLSLGSLSLAVLLVVILARRRTSDPLLR